MPGTVAALASTTVAGVPAGVAPAFAAVAVAVAAAAAAAAASAAIAASAAAALSDSTATLAAGMKSTGFEANISIPAVSWKAGWFAPPQAASKANTGARSTAGISRVLVTVKFL
jgi:hypothetical protein